MKAALVVSLTASIAFGASVSGRIHDGTTGVGGMQVRLWGQGPKGYSFQSPYGAVTTADGNGNYTFTGVAAGSYKVDTRMPNGVTGNWGDRWFDAVPPSADGYVMEDADVFTLAASDSLPGLDIQVEVNGGFDGRAVNQGNANQGGIQSRAELISDRRVHHNDTTKSDAFWPGLFSFRGLRPGATRLILHDPNYNLADTIRTPVTVTSNTAPTISNVVMAPAPADAREPNNDASASGAGFDATIFRGATPTAFTANGAIGPRASGDTDWYCFDGLATDRFIVDVGGTLTLEDNTVVTSPWVDPTVSFWSGATKLGEDDDSGPGVGARLDTGELGTAGRYCVVVSTFGDTAWNGTNQQTAGTYALRIALGNRRPSLTASFNGSTTTMINANEGDALAIALDFTDPDGNITGGTFEIRDAQSTVVAGGTFNTSTGSYTVNWTASQTAQRGGPYQLVATVADGEFTTTSTVNIVIAGVNVAPSAPRLFFPDAGATVTTRTPTLSCLEADDVDEETLSYEFDLSWADGGAQSGMVVGVDGGWRFDAGTPPEVLYAATAIPENSTVTWRVRAFDGTALNGYSVWSDEWTFFVDSINDPPGTPVLNKPNDGEELMTRAATLESSNPVDPENEDVTLLFEVARDIAFSNVVVNSGQVATTTGSTTTSWTVPMNLDWGTTYYGRVTATDARGASSPRSNVNEFRVRMNSSPTPPTLTGLTCGTVNVAPSQVTVGNVSDVEQDAIQVEVKVFLASQDPATATAIFSQTFSQQGMADTVVSLSSVQWMEDTEYRVRVRFLDGFNMTAWTECVFTLDAMMPPMGGGSGATGGGTAATGGGSGSTGGGSGTGGGVAMGGGAGETGGGTGEMGGGTEGGGTGGGGDGVAKPGCGCTSVDPLAPFALLLGFVLRRRRVR
ncbi:MAG: MYXO-CTERM sorting domain-containing protein [Archangium sp.]